MRLTILIAALTLAAGAALSGSGRQVRADEPAIDVPAAERSFAVGDLTSRPGDSIERTDDVARALAWIYDSYWRPGRASAHRIEYDPKDVATAHAVALTTYATAGPGATPPVVTHDPFPVVTALVLDRIRRERDGLHSTRSSGPLAAVATKQDDIGRFLDYWIDVAYGGPAAGPQRDPEADRTRLYELREAARRSRSIALGAAASLVGLAIAAAWILGRRWGSAASDTPTNPTGAPPPVSASTIRSGS